MNTDIPIWQLTVGELVSVIQETIRNEVKEIPMQPNEEKGYYGIKGISEIFNCSLRTAQNIKSSGVIDKAIIQYGRTIVVDKEKALNLVKKGQK